MVFFLAHFCGMQFIQILDIICIAEHYLPYNLLVAILGVVGVLDHADGVATPLLQHTGHLCELVPSAVVLQDGVEIVIITSIEVTT